MGPYDAILLLYILHNITTPDVVTMVCIGNGYHEEQYRVSLVHP